LLIAFLKISLPKAVAAAGLEPLNCGVMRKVLCSITASQQWFNVADYVDATTVKMPILNRLDSKIVEHRQRL
jgi:hypothetical protein